MVLLFSSFPRPVTRHLQVQVRVTVEVQNIVSTASANSSSGLILFTSLVLMEFEGLRDANELQIGTLPVENEGAGFGLLFACPIAIVDPQ